MFYWGVMDTQHPKQKLLDEPSLYRVGIEGRLFNTKVFWSWNLYALYQAALVLYIGMVFTQDSPTPSGRTYSFWAGGHICYLMCVILANFVLLRETHLVTGWGELLIFLQLTSYLWIIYLDSILLKTSVIAYFSDEFYGSWTAWLGVLLISFLVPFESGAKRAVLLIRDRYKELKRSKEKAQIVAQRRLSLQPKPQIDNRMSINSIGALYDAEAGYS